MDNIRGKTIVITGAARGIGYATAQALLARGARVVIGDRDIDVLENAVAGVSSLGQVSGHPLDVTDRESFAAFLDKARADGGGHIDVLINNAGVMPVGPFLEQSAQAIRSSIEVNFYGVLTGCQLVLPDMVKRRSGHIVNIASLAGMVAIPGQVVYAGTKFAVVGVSTALADEFAPYGVKVTAVLPTFTNTELISGTSPSAAQNWLIRFLSCWVQSVCDFENAAAHSFCSASVRHAAGDSPVVHTLHTFCRHHSKLKASSEHGSVVSAP